MAEAADVDLLDSLLRGQLASGELDLVWALGVAVGASVAVEDLVSGAEVRTAGAIVEQREEPLNEPFS